MNKVQLLAITNEKFLAVLLLILSFLPVEPTCVPGNRLLLFSPFIYLGVRFLARHKIKKIDVAIALGFVALIIFMAGVAAMADCTQDYTFTEVVQPEWQRISIDSLGPDGKVYIKNIKSLQIAVSDILVHVNNTQVPCIWEYSVRYIAPDEIKYCQLPVVCGNRSVLVEFFAPGNNDSILC